VRGRESSPQGLEPFGPSARGWVLCMLSCAALGIIVPCSDILLRSSQLSLNLLPSTSIVIVLVFVAIFNLLLARWSGRLALRRQDLSLIFCCTMVVSAIPSNGWLDYLTAVQMGPYYYARPENNWEKVLHPYLTPGLSPQDPTDPNSMDPRPVEWFFAGLPPDRSVPWDLLIFPYLRWALMLFLVLGLFFSVGALLYRQWSVHERLPFPLAQVPETLLAGVGEPKQAGSFLTNRMAWWGIFLVFALHGWNALGDLIPNWAQIPLRITHLHVYLTEPPWRHLSPLYVNIYPAVIGISYLISLEVSFSVWFFFFVLRMAMLVAILGWGLGTNGWDFGTTEGPRSLFIGQGTGACLALVFAGFYMARATLKDSLKQALGLTPREPSGDISPRAIWLLGTVCATGMLIWLVWAGADWYWAVPGIALLVISATGVARLVAESGVFLVQMQASPSELLCSAFTPAALGARDYVVLSQWSRAFCFDWYRTCPFTNLFGALHLGALTGLRQKHLLLGLAGALVMVLAGAFYGFYSTIYHMPGGARQIGWQLDNYPRQQAQTWTSTLQQMESYSARKAESATTGATIPASEVPAVARTDTYYLSWMGVGAVMLAAFLFIRTRFFWWPHPIGYVLWMGERPLRQIWFSCFVGWFLKWALLKFGGHRQYLAWRSFFIGLIVGEAFATAFWLIVKAVCGITGGYAIEIN
jgi:hypothetical protein